MPMFLRRLGEKGGNKEGKVYKFEKRLKILSYSTKIESQDNVVMLGFIPFVIRRIYLESLKMRIEANADLMNNGT